MGRELPPFSEPTTSRDAAESMVGAHEALKAQVHAHIRSCGPMGCTDEECQQALSMGGNTQRPRRVDLRDEGRVVKSGLRRKGSSGRSCTVWIAVEYQCPTCKGAKRVKRDLFSEVPCPDCTVPAGEV